MTLLLSAADFFPRNLTLANLRTASKKCKGCHLFKCGKQTVFGTGLKTAKLMIVGEIPGEKEDDLGKPFVGPAGMLLRNTLEDAKINLKDVYLTNVVKHFKYVRVGNKNLHRSPVAKEIKACRPWLQAEIAIIQPQLILCLGSTAAQTLVRKDFRITKERGKWFKFLNSKTIVTYHPSAILRAPKQIDRHKMKKTFFQDLKKIAAYL